MHCLLALACYEAIIKKYTKKDDIANRAHEQFFRNIQRIGFVEHLMKSEGNFSEFLECVPIESHGINSRRTSRHSSKLKQMPLGNITNAWFIDEKYTEEMWPCASASSLTQLAPTRA